MQDIEVLFDSPDAQYHGVRVCVGEQHSKFGNVRSSFQH